VKTAPVTVPEALVASATDIISTTYIQPMITRYMVAAERGRTACCDATSKLGYSG
jgi:hypothetical protein